MSNLQEDRSRYVFPGQPDYHPPGHPDHVPPCAFLHDFDKLDWRCNCRATFDSLDELSDHVKAYNDARREWDTHIRNEGFRKWMAPAAAMPSTTTSSGWTCAYRAAATATPTAPNSQPPRA